MSGRIGRTGSRGTDGRGGPGRRPRRALAVGGVALAAVTVLGATSARPAAASTHYPVIYNGFLGYGGHALTPDVPAAGSILVDWRSTAPTTACHSSSHPYPVVLLEGTGANQADDFAAVSPLLADNGYCVYTVNVGAAAGSPLDALGDIPTSAGEVATTVDKVLAATGAAKVDLVGHSQGGGVLPRWYLKYDGGGAKVDKLVGLAPSNHGTTLDGLTTLGTELGILGIVNAGISVLNAPALSQQEVGSSVNATLDQGGDTVPGVSYTTIVSRNDEVVTPYTQQFLTAGPGATVTNIVLQNVCWLDQGEHLSVVYDHIALQEMLNALDPAHASTPWCTPVLPLSGG